MTVKPFIVAEMSGNHLGSLFRALEIVEEAARCGADAIKLQTWAPGTMCLDKRFHVERGPWAGHLLDDLYHQTHTPWAWHKHIFDYAAKLGIVAFTTVFDHAALDFAESLGCPIYKIASFEIIDTPLIERVARTGKPMMISTGMATFDEIATAWGVAMSNGCPDITLMHCISAYPSRPVDANLATMVEMQKAFGSGRTSVGLSDHSMSLGVPTAAAALGARVIEKHLTLRRADGGHDAAFSLEPEEFAGMAIAVRDAAETIGEPIFGQKTGETAELRRSIYVRKDMKAGQVISDEDIATSRPAQGLPPRMIGKLVGKVMLKDVDAGTPFSADMID